MKRNWYAFLILAALAAAVACSELWVEKTAQELDRSVRLAYACAAQGDYAGSKAAFRAAAELNREKRKILELLVRRSLLDKVGETLATLPSYACADNMADLSVETERVCEQLDQLSLSFLAWF